MSVRGVCACRGLGLGVGSTLGRVEHPGVGGSACQPLKFQTSDVLLPSRGTLSCSQAAGPPQVLSYELTPQHPSSPAKATVCL